MKARTMAHLKRADTPHTGWCARDHRCGLDVHRSADVLADGPFTAQYPPILYYAAKIALYRDKYEEAVSYFVLFDEESGRKNGESAEAESR